jgi:hypothetical protein
MRLGDAERWWRKLVELYNGSRWWRMNPEPMAAQVRELVEEFRPDPKPERSPGSKRLAAGPGGSV